MGIVLSLYLYCVYSSTIIKTPDQLHWRWLKVWLASFLARWKEGLSERWSTSCCDLPFDEISERRVVQLLNWNVSSQVSFTKIFCNLLYPHLSLAWWLMTDFMVVVLCWACFSAAEMLNVVMFPNLLYEKLPVMIQEDAAWLAKIFPRHWFESRLWTPWTLTAAEMFTCLASLY